MWAERRRVCSTGCCPSVTATRRSAARPIARALPDDTDLELWTACATRKATTCAARGTDIASVEGRSRSAMRHPSAIFGASPETVPLFCLPIAHFGDEQPARLLVPELSAKRSASREEARLAHASSCPPLVAQGFPRELHPTVPLDRDPLVAAGLPLHGQVSPSPRAGGGIGCLLVLVCHDLIDRLCLAQAVLRLNPRRYLSRCGGRDASRHVFTARLYGVLRADPLCDCFRVPGKDLFVLAFLSPTHVPLHAYRESRHVPLQGFATSGLSSGLS